jgi:hypothetical protein
MHAWLLPEDIYPSDKQTAEHRYDHSVMQSWIRKSLSGMLQLLQMHLVPLYCTSISLSYRYFDTSHILQRLRRKHYFTELENHLIDALILESKGRQGTVGNREEGPDQGLQGRQIVGALQES